MSFLCTFEPEPEPTPDDNTGLPGYGVALIVIACLAVAGIGGYFTWKKFKGRKTELLTS